MKNKNEIIYDRDLSNPEKKMRKKRKRPANSKENSVNNSFNNDEERGTQKKDTVITQNNVSNLKVVSPENQNVEDFVEDDEKKKNNNLQNQKPFQKTPIKLTKDVIQAIDKDKSNIDNNNKDNNNNILVTNEKDKDKIIQENKNNVITNGKENNSNGGLYNNGENKNTAQNVISKGSISDNKKIIVATGGGICDNNEAIRFLTTNTVFIYLFVDEKTAIERIIREAQTDGEKITNQDSIPSYLAKKNPQTISDLRNFFHNFYVERTKKYSMLADITINQGDSSIEENTKKIISAIKPIQH